MSYWTYVSRTVGELGPMLVLEIDRNVDGLVDDRLFFQPAYQRPSTGNPACPDQGPVRLNAWQGWTPSDGCWWNAGGDFGSPGDGVEPLSAYIATYPDAAAAFVAFEVGGGEPRDVFRSNLDALHMIWARPETGVRIAYDFGL